MFDICAYVTQGRACNSKNGTILGENSILRNQQTPAPGIQNLHQQKSQDIEQLAIMLSIEKTSYNEKDVWQECHEACTQQPRGAHRLQHSNQSDSLASHALLGPPSMPHPVMQVPEEIWKT